MKIKFAIQAVIVLLIVGVVLYEGIWKWGVCYYYVPEGSSLQVRYKGNLFLPSPEQANNRFAHVDEDGTPLEVGVLEHMPGPGRYFRFDPFHYERMLVPDVLIEPGEVGIVNSRLGKEPSAEDAATPEVARLADGDIGSTDGKGVLKRVLTPGRYRINPYGYTVDVRRLTRVDSGGLAEVRPMQTGVTPASDQNSSPRAQPQRRSADSRRTGLDRRASVTSYLPERVGGWLEIPPGYVGVVKDQVRGGVRDEVLQPGTYVINPYVEEVTVVEIGYRETTIDGELAVDEQGSTVHDEHGEPIMAKGGAKGITFPSNDGFDISLDFTTIWGILPDQAPMVVQKLGNVAIVESSVILPKIESICRNEGSKLSAVDLLTGDTREQFQRKVSDAFRTALEKESISLQVGLVRHIYIPAEVREPRQKANIAEETKLTRDTEIETAKIEANLEEARANVEKEAKTVEAETEKLYQQALAEGRKEVEEISAETQKLVAAIAKQTAEAEAQARLELGKADAEVEKMKNEAEAQRFELAVQAFETPEAYNQWVFANGLPDDLRLMMLYAGEGTFWTDLKGFSNAALGKLVGESESKPESAARGSATSVPAPSRPTSRPVGRQR